MTAAAMPSLGAKCFKKDSYGTVANPDIFYNQDYGQLKKDCLRRCKKFVDEMFPPDKTSIGNVDLDPFEKARLLWKRPKVSAQTALGIPSDFTQTVKKC